MNVQISLQESGPRSWTATATASGSTGMGSGSSAAVAASRAVQKLIERGPGLSSAPSRRFYITAGKRKGQQCAFLAVVAILTDGNEVYQVRYDDGKTGEEESKYLREVKANGEERIEHRA